MTQGWRLSVYDLALGAKPVTLPGQGFRFVYAAGAPVEGRSAAGDLKADQGDGFLVGGEVVLQGSATAWVWDADPAGSAPIQADGLSLVLSRRFELPEGEQRLIRADRVQSHSGAQTPRHGHRGPGIRRLLYGRLLAEVGEGYDRIEAGQPWFETGHEPVVGTNIHTGDSAFVRVMVLPIELRGGKSSFVPTTPEEATKPRAVTYRLFGEKLAEGS
jgi:hypothetical protein